MYSIYTIRNFVYLQCHRQYNNNILLICIRLVFDRTKGECSFENAILKWTIN